MAGHYLRCKALAGESKSLAKAAMSIVAERVREGEVLSNIDLALTEACANVVRHAYKGREPGDLALAVSFHPPSHVELEIIDWGIGLETAPHEVKNARPEAEGGRGLFIMSQLAETVEVRRLEDRNCVLLRIAVDEAAWKSGE